MTKEGTMAKDISLREHSSARFFTGLLFAVGLTYVITFVLSLLYFPQVRDRIFHPLSLAMLIRALIDFLGHSLTKLLYLLIAYQIFRLLGLIKKGDPFNQESPKRIRRFAYYTFGIAAINVVRELESVLTIAKQGFPYWGFWLNLISFLLKVSETVFFGLGILIIAVVLEEGVKLQQDQKLTV
jgi:hypothetical protein